MKRVTGAAAILLATLSASGCSTGPVGTGAAAPATSIVSSGRPHTGSACLTTATTGSPRAMIEWADFVQLDGLQYVARFDGTTPDVASSQLGPVVGRVECQLSALTFHGEVPAAVDGDAAYVPVGTEVRAIRGFAPRCRVAAKVEGVNRVYLADDHVVGVTAKAPCAKPPDPRPEPTTTRIVESDGARQALPSCRERAAGSVPPSNRTTTSKEHPCRTSSVSTTSASPSPTSTR